jgi:hypothetical protein
LTDGGSQGVDGFAGAVLRLDDGFEGLLDFDPSSLNALESLSGGQGTSVPFSWLLYSLTCLRDPMRQSSTSEGREELQEQVERQQREMENLRDQSPNAKSNSPMPRSRRGGTK